MNRDRDPDKRSPEDELSQEELEGERAGTLPDREALSVVNADVAIPADPSIAADVLAGEDPPPDADEVPEPAPPEDAPPEEAPPEEAPPEGPSES